MPELSHRIRVFVYRFVERVPTYLLLRSAHGFETFWSPLHGPINFDEKMEGAIHREVRADIGISRPQELIDLRMPSRWVLGDEEIIEWNYGFQTPPTAGSIRLDDERWREFRWAPFGITYPSLQLETDRAAIMRLHTTLQAA